MVVASEGRWRVDRGDEVMIMRPKMEKNGD